MRQWAWLHLPPPLLENHLGDLDVEAVGVVALAALHARNQATLLVSAECAAHDADVLSQHEFVLKLTL